MSPVEDGRELVFLDACCLINLFATGRIEQILSVLEYRFAVAQYVAEEEVLEIEDEELGKRKSVRALIEELIENDLLERLRVTSEEEQIELVKFAAQVDDGEAHTFALAVVRGARVATDDKKAIRVFETASGGESSSTNRMDPCLRTSELLFEWADRQRIPEAELRQVVRVIAYRASFFPPKSDPHFERWIELLQEQ